MSSLETGYEHIVINEDAVPVIDGTGTKVIELVIENMSYGWSPEELHLQHRYLSLGQIHSALGYYWDHKDELTATSNVVLNAPTGCAKRWGSHRSSTN